MSEDLEAIRGLLESRAASAWRQDGEVAMRLEELLKVAGLLTCIDRLTQEKSQLEREVQRLQGIIDDVDYHRRQALEQTKKLNARLSDGHGREIRSSTD
jgi:hypothetical protein